MSTTTIRVPVRVRERLAEMAASEGLTVGQAVQHLIEEHEKRLFVKGLAEDFRRLQSDPEAWEFYQSEVALWDSALLDGLETEADWEG